jgi:hypothetical protein
LRSRLLDKERQGLQTGSEAFGLDLALAVQARPQTALPVNLYHDVSGWTLVFAVLVCAVICDAFGIWMGWLSTH